LTYAALPDNATIDVTPETDAPFCKYFLYHTKHKLLLLANNNDLHKTIPEFCVGQKVTFSADLDPPVLSNDILARWRLPLNYVNDKWQRFNIIQSGNVVYYGSENYRVNDSILDGMNTYAWYTNTTSGDVSMNINIRFGNGQSVSLAGAGHFSIYRPTFVPGSFLCNPHRLFFYQDGVLCYGDILSGFGSMIWDIELNSKYEGKYGVTQLVKGYYLLGAFPIMTTFGGWWLDGNTEFYDDALKPYMFNSEISHNYHFHDKPQAGFSSSDRIYMIAEFKDYIRFRPNAGGEYNNILVTIGFVRWRFEAEVSDNPLFPIILNYDAPAAVFNGSIYEMPEWERQKSE
jgi:hypothetical protein